MHSDSDSSLSNGIRPYEFGLAYVDVFPVWTKAIGDVMKDALMRSNEGEVHCEYDNNS